MNLKFIGNYLEELEKIFSLSKKVWYSEHGTGNPPAEVEKLENLLFEKSNWESKTNASWCNPSLKSVCYWHADGSYHVIVGAYPDPTYFLLNNDGSPVLRNKLGNLVHNDAIINKKIKNGEYKIFVPNKGDFYYMPPTTIHKTNPNAVGKKRLCVRIHSQTQIPLQK